MSLYLECPSRDFSCTSASSLRYHEGWGWSLRDGGASLIDRKENVVNIHIGDKDKEPIPPPKPTTPARQSKSRSPIKPPEVRVAKPLPIMASKSLRLMWLRLLRRKRKKKNMNKIMYNAITGNHICTPSLYLAILPLHLERRHWNGY